MGYIEFIVLYLKDIKKTSMAFIAITLAFSLVTSFSNTYIHFYIRDMVNGQPVLPILLSIVTLFSLSKVFSEAKFWIYSRWEKGMMATAYANLHTAIVKLSPTVYHTRKPGEWNSVLDQSVFGLKLFLFEAIFFAFPLFVEIFLFFLLSYRTIGQSISITFFVGITLYLIMSIFLGGWLRKYQINIRERKNKLSSFNVDAFVAYSTINQLGLNETINEEKKRYINDYTETQHRFYRNRSILGFIQATPLLGLIVLVNYFLYLDYQKDTNTVGNFVVINSFLIYIFQSLESFNVLYRNLVRSWSDFTSVRDYFVSSRHNTPNKLEELETAVELIGKDIEISPLFTPLNFKLESGDFVRVQGESGSGKSTFLKKLSNGSLLDDQGFAIRGANLDQLKIIYLSSEMTLLPMSVENHMRASPKEYQAIIAKYGSQHLGGLTKSNTCSQGERQQLLLLSALELKPHILIIDEATNSIDSRKEKHIFEAADLAQTIVLYVRHTDVSKLRFHSCIETKLRPSLINTIS